nr:endonuclease [Aeromicrobium sp.]
MRDRTRRVWAAFTDGRIDFSRVRDIAHTIDQLQRDESIARLERLVVGYAVDHTGAELRQWLRRFVQRVEADLAIERADDERANRHVSIKHTDDSMAWLNAYLPSHEAAAIEARLRREARRAVDPDDPRTVAQREADLLVAWCTGADAATSAADANIAVTIGADVLAGANPGLAQSTDGRWAVPAQWVTDLARTGNLFWHRIITEPITGDVLSHEYLGLSDHRPSAARQAPGRSPAATKSLKRRGTSRAPHRQPWPEGPTRADNLGPLCRRHHQMKGHGILRWTTRPAKGPPPLVIEIYSSPVSMEYAG